MPQPDIACRAPAVSSGPWNPNRRYGIDIQMMTVNVKADMPPHSSFVESHSSGNEKGFYTISR